MKPVVAFYTACLIILYSILTFIGYRKENLGNAREGILPEVVVTARPVKTDEPLILEQHFNKVIYSLNKKQNNIAADQLYDGLMVFVMRGVSSGNYDNDQFRTITNNLKDCYLDIKLTRSISLSKIKENFESAELYIAKELLLRSSKDLRKNDLENAIEDVKKAEECIAVATNYSALPEKTVQEEIFNGSRNFLENIIQTRRENSATMFWKHFWYRINNTEGRAI